MRRKLKKKKRVSVFFIFIYSFSCSELTKTHVLTQVVMKRREKKR